VSSNEERLIEYLPWAQRFARACTVNLPSHLDHDNLQAAGMLGYLHAASRYDASRGASFRGFCTVRIRGAVLDELRRWDWAPRSVHKSQRCITNVMHALMEKLEREPTCAELAQELGIEPSELAAYQTQAQPHQLVSLDEIAEKAQGDDNLSLAERLSDPGAVAPDAAMLLAENRHLIRRGLNLLPKTEAMILEIHYFQNIPFRDVAILLAVTPSRVSQLHHQALGHLKQIWCRIQALP